LSGVGNGIGANFGVLYEPLKGVKFGLSYRTQIFVHHTGELQLSFPSFVRGVPSSIDGSADVVYPPSLTFGACVNRFAPFTFDFDATMTGGSTYDGLELKLSKLIPLSGYPVNSLFFYEEMARCLGPALRGQLAGEGQYKAQSRLHL
jgi:long-subunit fatty acid transport protein